MDPYADVVRIDNSGTNELADVHLVFQGGECTLSKFPGCSTRMLLINVSGESSLAITFRDSKGLEHGQHFDIYLEPGYSGKVHINIDKSNNVTLLGTAKP